jgi:hypothetical protein
MAWTYQIDEKLLVSIASWVLANGGKLPAVSTSAGNAKAWKEIAACVPEVALRNVKAPHSACMNRYKRLKDITAVS